MYRVLIFIVLAAVACQGKKGPCDEEKEQALLKAKQGLLGNSIPQCEEDGTYKAKQCSAGTGFCQCVDLDGTKISNASRLLKDCECVRKSYQVTSMKLIGAYKPTCNKDGTYTTKQCHSSTGYCWCVDEAGVRITNGTSIRDCECSMKRHLSMKSNLLGAFRPRCENDGSYSSLQSHAGMSFCVDDFGREVTNRSRSLLDCKCPIEKYNAVSSQLLGAFRPKCDQNGFYGSIQCHERSCYCSRRDGSRIENVKSASLEVCNCYRQADDIIKTGLGISLPDCEM